ncbi:MAG: heme exporter protein CcmB [Rhodobacteraceae bacterium]|nr:heme exporter protein CcmB [Paracoccaceae bacterium]
MKAVFLRDLRLAFRLGGGAGQSLAFFLIAITLLALGVGPAPDLLSRLAPGALWVFALLACLLSLDRLFQADYEDGSLDHLLLAPTPLEGVALAKSAAHWLTTAAPLALFAPVLGAMLNLPDAAMGTLVTALLLGTPALSLIGAIGAALTVGVRRGGLLLSLLVLPLYLPTLIFGAMAVRAAAEGLPVLEPLALLGALTLGCAALGPFAAAAALRINLS